MSQINSFRGLLYKGAKILGDAQAAQKAIEQGSMEPLVKRAARVYSYRQASSFLSKLFR